MMRRTADRTSVLTTLTSGADIYISMANFEAASKRILDKMICMKCNARNPKRADHCRKCGYAKLRPKAKERRAT
jgi:large subunit ribosomal protein L40e